MRNKQRGATIWINLIWLVIIMFLGIVGVKIVPYYLDNYTVAGALEGLNRESDLEKLGNKQIHTRLGKQFTINGIRNIEKDEIVIERNKTRLIAVNIDYEIREHLFFNVDIMLTFKNRLDVSGPREAK